MTDAEHDEKIQKLQAAYGFAGIGRFWRLCEIIGSQMNESEKHDVEYSTSYLCKRLGMPNGTLLGRYLGTLSGIGLGTFSLRPCHTTSHKAEAWLCSIPNLLNIRDNRIKNRVQKNVLEVEEDSRSRIRTPIVPKRDDKEFQEFWNEYPRKIGRAKVEKIWQKIMRDTLNSGEANNLAHKIIESVKSQKKTNQLGNPDQNFVPHPSTWLNQKRWQDEIETKRLNGSGSTIDDGEGEWVKIMEHIRRKGTGIKMEGISDRGRSALLKIGGMGFLGQALTKQIPFIKKDFKNAYMEVGK